MNQKEIDSFDQHIWRHYRQLVYNNIKKLSVQRNFDFVEPNSIHNVFSLSKITVSALVYDLIMPADWWNELDQKLLDQGKRIYFFTDNIVGKSYKFSAIKIFSIPEILGITANYSNIQFTGNTKTKLFNCFIQRTDSVRQSWFYFLHDKNLLNLGYVSYLLKQLPDYCSLTGEELFTWIHEHYELGQLPHFEQAYNSLKYQVPYQNFEEQNNLVPLMLDSKYSVNLETYANNDQDCWCFTEKSLRSLQLPTIDLMFLQTGGYQVLKNLGFELLDHSEFDELPWQHRQQKLLDILENDAVDLNDKLLEEQAHHNQNLMIEWKNQVLSDTFFIKYFDSINV